MILLTSVVFHVLINGVLTFSPQEFQKYYSTSTESFRRKPHTSSSSSSGGQQRPFYGYIAPSTDRPKYVIPAPQDRPWTTSSQHTQHGGSITTTPLNSGKRPYKRPPNTIYGYIKPTQPHSTYKQHGIEFHRPGLEQVQNLVHLRNLHSLMQETNAKRRIPYGIIRSGRGHWDEGEEEDGSSERRSWIAEAIVSDQLGDESVVIERGVRYRGPRSPSTLSSSSKYDTIELPVEASRNRRGFEWADKSASENSITKKPMNSLLKPKEIRTSTEKEIDIENQLDLPEVRSVLRKNPVTFRTKVSASLGIQDTPEFQVISITNPEEFNEFPTPTELIVPLRPPPISNSLSDSFTSVLSTTVENNNAVLPSPHDLFAQIVFGATQPTRQSSSYSSTPTSYGTGASYAGPSGSSSYATTGGFIPSTGPSSYGSGSKTNPTYGSGGSSYGSGGSPGAGGSSYGSGGSPGSGGPSYGSGGSSGSGGPSYGSGGSSGSGGPSYGSGGSSGSGGPSYGSGGSSGSGGPSYGSGGSSGSGGPSYGLGGSSGSGGPSYGSGGSPGPSYGSGGQIGNGSYSPGSKPTYGSGHSPYESGMLFKKSE